jgi:uncharacterized protein (DUF2147 family)
VASPAGLWKTCSDRTGESDLDPDEGKIYRCTVTLKDDGRGLEIRGFIGVSLFGRTQVWTRVK